MRKRTGMQNKYSLAIKYSNWISCHYFPSIFWCCSCAKLKIERVQRVIIWCMRLQTNTVQWTCSHFAMNITTTQFFGVRVCDCNCVCVYLLYELLEFLSDKFILLQSKTATNYRTSLQNLPLKMMIINKTNKSESTWKHFQCHSLYLDGENRL